MIALLRYHLTTYIKASKFVMPLAAYIIFLLMFCTGTVDSALQMFSVSSIVAYFMMVWSGFTFTDSEELIAEQISILKSGNNKKFYLSKNIFISLWGLIFAVTSVLVPTVWAIINSIFKFGDFKHFTVMNILISFIVHICVCILGGAVGFLWHPRIITNRKIAAIGAFSFGMLGVLSGPLSIDIPALTVGRYLFPPVYNIVEQFTFVEDKLILGNMLIPALICMIYAEVLVAINVIVLNKKGF